MGDAGAATVTPASIFSNESRESFSRVAQLLELPGGEEVPHGIVSDGLGPDAHAPSRRSGPGR